MRLRHPAAVELVLDDLLLDDLLREFELVDAVDEVLLREVVARASCARTFNCLIPDFLILHNLLQAKELVFA